MERYGRPVTEKRGLTMGKLSRDVAFLKQIDILQFIYLNYICKSVVRKDGSKIVPYKHAVIDIAPSARLFLQGGNLEIGGDALSGSRAETFLRIREQAEWESAGGCRLSYGSTLELLMGARLRSSYFTMNTGSTLVSAKEIRIGQDVMIARNAVIYDSDFHNIRDMEGKITNPPAGVVIGNHVWIGTGAIILKGTKIGQGTVIAAGTRISGNVEAGCICRNDGSRQLQFGFWER